MNGIEIVQRVYERLRRPADSVLPYQTVVNTLRERIASKKLDLALSDQNALAATSEWFTPSYQDFELHDIGLDAVLLPIRLEKRSADSEYETGMQVPIVNYEVLETSVNGAVSFYGSPLRIAFRDPTDHIIEQQYRLVYETDFHDNVNLDQRVQLPNYFASMLGSETADGVIDLVEDSSPEWAAFVKAVTPKLQAEIEKVNLQWFRFANRFKGKAVVPKRTFLQNRQGRQRVRYFQT